MRLIAIIFWLVLGTTGNAAAQHKTKLPDCEYSVTFPYKPRVIKYEASERPGYFLMTESKDGLPILRVECQAIADRSALSDQLVLKSLKEQAESTGLNNVQVTLEHSKLGVIGTFTGRKIASGFQMIQMGRIYIGELSVLNLLITEKLESFPSIRANDFINSVQR
jgi:hypothetical protein